MKNLKISLCMVGSLALLLAACNGGTDSRNSKTPNMAPIAYPETALEVVSDTFFGQVVSDPYRWLEDDTSKPTADWVDRQNEVTFAHLNSIPFRDKIRERLETLSNYERFSAPSQEGDWYYFGKNDGLQNQSLIYRQKSLESEPELFLDPNTFSDDGTVALTGLQFSHDGQLAVVRTASSGSDWNKMQVINTETGQMLSDSLSWIKFSGAAWYKNGFFYATYDKPEEGKEYSAFTSQHKLYYHQLGTAQSEDQVVFGSDQSFRYLSASVTHDERFLVVAAAISTSGNALYVKDLRTNGPFKELVGDFDHDHSLIHNEGNKLYIQTNWQAPNIRIVTAEFPKAQREHWADFIPERDYVMEYTSQAGGKFFGVYLQDASTHVYQFAADGSQEREIKLPTIGTASGFGGKNDQQTLFYSFTSYTYPTTIYRYDLASGQSTVFRQPKLKDFDPSAYETKEVFYNSKDGERIHMFITHKKGLELNGQNPTYLYGYGGFNISLSPSFSTINLLWLENGGILAIPNLRGGGEYGEKWHKAGTQLQKQNVFDDFIAAAEYLKEKNYTSTEKLCISGRSNGGLLVGATMTQRPDLCAVALPGVGVLDMLRYHRFTAGAGWISDYGCADSSKTMFEYLYGYSPVHNTPKADYPATLVTTADHDDRVVPAHSFKFIAALQVNHTGDDPVLIRIDKKAGHGAGKPLSKTLDEWADIWAFVYFHTRENPYPDSAF